MKTVRQSSIELLRIFAMLAIIAHHYSCHGGAYIAGGSGISTYISTFLVAGGKIGVNLFILISGYFLIDEDFRLIRIIKLELSVLFYSIVFWVIACYVWKIETINFISVRNTLLPSLTNLGTRYWFIPCYFAILLLSPFLNRLVHTLNKKECKALLGIYMIFLCIIPTVIQCPSWLDGHISLFVFMYLIGAYIKIYKIQLFNEKKYLNLVLGFVLYMFMVSLTYIIKVHGEVLGLYGIGADSQWGSSSVWSVMISIFVFSFFAQLNIGNIKGMNAISKTTIGIYLIHDNVYVRQYM